MLNTYSPTRDKPANRHQICLHISIAMMVVILAQSLKLLVLSDVTSILFHLLNLGMHFLLFASVLVCLILKAFNQARNLLIIGFNSYIAVSCLLWEYDVGVQNYFLLALFISIYLIGGNEKWQLLITLGFELIAFVGFSLALPKLHTLQIKQNVQALGVIEQTNSLVFALSCCICALFIRHLLSRNWQALRHYKAQQACLINHLLPSDIAKVLLTQNTTKNHHYELNDTSLYQRKTMAVLFLDICGFTESMVNNEDKSRQSTYSLFAHINQMCESFDATRVKTNGDQFILIIGMNSPHLSEHNICEQAVGLSSQITAFCRHQQKVSIRLGIALGEVVFGVFDINNPAFDIWGETVVRASRLEANAQSDEILVDEQFHKTLKRQHRFGKLNQLILKGIGSTKVYPLLV